ncbi:uncharacterized protein LOC116305107 [Actinia tenebrosa]|uniref:Uncharacterized protein LOC116305107 n=1 Tax=Actinia tenebrosa TaxID=6105 RepID=A0A6P8IXR2_ACTTE|nr:uncharacterized protein LOC116305107 [Actinia tenebrosa]
MFCHLLKSGVSIPLVGLGTYQLRSTGEDDLVHQTLDHALGCGYRLIDTASVYRNEADIGKALKTLCPKYGLSRQDLFITSKLGPKSHGFENAKMACEKSIQDLDCGYLDMYLIHWPGAQKLKSEDPMNAKLRAESWRALEDLKQSGLVKAIGVSNYTTSHLEELLAFAAHPPTLLQVEFHPLLYQKDLLDFCNQNNIWLQAYTSLGQGKILEEPVVNDITKRYSISPAQVLLKWGLQHGVGVIPKSTNAQHIKENIQLFDFTLSEDDMKKLDELNNDKHFCWNASQVA